jgi:hypothetical protein
VKPYLLLLFCLCLWANTAFAQKKCATELPKIAKTVDGFLPKGYHKLAEATGDLNKDGLPDAAFVMENADSCRILVVAFAKADKTYALQSQNAHFILHSDEGGMLGDPFDKNSLQIANNVLTVFFEGGAGEKWSAAYKFRWQRNDMQLIGATNTSLYTFRDEIETYDFNFNTQKMQHTKGKMDSDKNDIDQIIKIKTPHKTLQTMQHAFAWEVVKGVFI